MASALDNLKNLSQGEPTFELPYIKHLPLLKVKCRNLISRYAPAAVGQQKLITLTFRDTERVRNLKPRTLWFKTLPKIVQNLLRITPRFLVFPELTAKGMLHYHLMIDTNNYLKLKAFIGWWQRLYGNTDEKQISPGDWFKVWIYCRKESWYMTNRVLLTHSPNSVKITSCIVGNSTGPLTVARIAKYHLYRAKRLKRQHISQQIEDKLGYFSRVLQKRVEIV